MSELTDLIEARRAEIDDVTSALYASNDTIQLSNMLALNAVLLVDIRFILTEMLTYQQQDRGLRP